jgi:tetratricopeptide (TPR) repeat protein
MASTSTEPIELDPVTQLKIDTAKQKKDTADQAFKTGELKNALRSYHESLMYLLGIDKNALKGLTGGAPPEPITEGEEKKQEKTEVDEMVEKIYANMSACHLKNENWQRALECANKALAKNENNYKAMFRKGKALGELGFFEKAEKVLEELKTKNPSDAAGTTAELSRLRAIDQAREKAHKQKLKGFLSREKPEKKTASGSGSGIEEIMSPGVAAGKT